MQRTRVKFCGMVRPDDAALAVLAGVDAVGIILHPGGRRSVDPAAARAITQRVSPPVMRVGVFVNESVAQIKAAVESSGVMAVQLHGDEGPDVAAALAPLPVIKMFRVDDALEGKLKIWRAAHARNAVGRWTALLLEAPLGTGEAGGTGMTNDFDRIEALQAAGAFDGLPPIVIAGGLTPDNVGAVVRRLRPWGVDVSSGIESAVGRKSAEATDAFVRAVQNADEE